MALNLEGLIIFALILNMLGFVVYALSMYTKKEGAIPKPKKSFLKSVKEPKPPKAPKVTDVKVPSPTHVPVQEEPATESVEATIPTVLPGEETEVQRLARELKEMHEEGKRPSDQKTSEAGLSIEEIYGLDKEDDEEEAERLEKELQSIQDEGQVEEVVETEKMTDETEGGQGYGVVFEEEIKEEVKEAKELTETPVAVPVEKEEKQYSIDTSEAINPTAEETKPKEGPYQEPKREIIDAVNILDIEVDDEDEEEEVQEEIVVRHYEPLAYAKEEEEEVVQEEEDEDAAIKRRIAYLTGEWTDDYIIQPKNKK